MISLKNHQDSLLKWLFLFNTFISKNPLSSFYKSWMILLWSLWKQLWVVIIGRRMFHCPVCQFLRNHINYFVWHFSKLTVSEMNDTLDFSMYSLIETNNYVIAWFPFETSLTCDNISWKHLFTTEFFKSILMNIFTRVFFLLSL